jgi:clan AA aspartic protease
LKGRVDDARRALLDVNARSKPSDRATAITAWIDTAFNGYFVFPKRLIDQLGLEQEAATDAILADGSRVTLESYVCFVEWFGTLIATQVVANEGRLPLLGTEMLAGHVLLIDYVQNRVSVD